MNPDASANLETDDLSLDLCNTTFHIPESNDSLFQGTVPKHEAIPEIDLGFSFISGLFCLPFYLDCGMFTSVALLKNPVVRKHDLGWYQGLPGQVLQDCSSGLCVYKNPSTSAGLKPQALKALVVTEAQKLSVSR